MKKWITLTLTVFMIYMISPAIVSGQFFFNLDDITGQEAPDFELPRLNSDQMKFSEFRGQDKAIVFFWATWCPHCRKQLENLNENAQLFENKKIKLAVVDLGETKKAVQKHVKRNKIQLDMFIDSDSVLTEPYGLIGVPTFYFVGEDGIVKDVLHDLPKDIDSIFKLEESN